MSTTITGIVTNGVVVPNSPLPEGAHVEIRVQPECAPAAIVPRITPAELRKLPRSERDVILAAAAELAEESYRTDKDLLGFDAFSEEMDDDDYSDVQ